MKTKQTCSDFGKGFIYNIVLFAKHFERFLHSIRENNELLEKYPNLCRKNNDSMWFNGAGDHFFEFEIPRQFKKTKIGKLAMKLQNEAIARRCNLTTSISEFNEFFKKLEKLCRMIDEKLGVEDIEANYD